MTASPRSDLGSLLVGIVAARLALAVDGHKIKGRYGFTIAP